MSPVKSSASGSAGAIPPLSRKKEEEKTCGPAALPPSKDGREGGNEEVQSAFVWANVWRCCRSLLHASLESAYLYLDNPVSFAVTIIIGVFVQKVNV